MIRPAAKKIRDWLAERDWKSLREEYSYRELSEMIREDLDYSAASCRRYLTDAFHALDAEEHREMEKAPSHGDSVLASLERDYYHNETDDVYVLQLSHRTRSVILPGQVVRDLKDAYSNWDGEPATINEICRAFEISRRDFQGIKSVMGWTHDSSPYTDEQLVTQDVGSLRRDLARKRERALEKADQKARWSRIEQDADKWRRLSRDTLEPMLEGLQDAPKRQGSISYAAPDGDYVVVHNPTDAHLDQMNADGTGFGENRERWLSAARACYDEVRAYRDRPAYIVVALGSDMFNVDTKGSTTTAGTPQGQSLPHAEAVYRVSQAGAELVEMAREVAPVVVRVVPGNHDWRTAVAYYWGIAQRYRDVDDVEVVGEARTWQYHAFGRCLFGFHHGHKIKGRGLKQAQWLAKKMATDVPKMWGESSRRYWFTGHLHHLAEVDDGVMVMQGPTTTPSDEWHDDAGYSGTHAGQCVYLFRRDVGHVARFLGAP